MLHLKNIASKSSEVPQTHPILTQPAQFPLQQEAWAATLRDHILTLSSQATSLRKFDVAFK